MESVCFSEMHYMTSKNEQVKRQTIKQKMDQHSERIYEYKW